MLSNQAVVQKQALVIRHELRKEPWLLGAQCLFLLRMGDQSDPQSWEQLVPLPALWQLNGAGIGFLQRLCNAEARYVARVLRWGARDGVGTTLVPTPTRRRIKKMLSKGR